MREVGGGGEVGAVAGRSVIKGRWLQKFPIIRGAACEKCGAGSAAAGWSNF